MEYIYKSLKVSKLKAILICEKLIGTHGHIALTRCIYWLPPISRLTFNVLKMLSIQETLCENRVVLHLIVSLNQKDVYYEAIQFSLHNMALGTGLRSQAEAHRATCVCTHGSSLGSEFRSRSSNSNPKHFFASILSLIPNIKFHIPNSVYNF